jgi:hypothetical protein
LRIANTSNATGLRVLSIQSGVDATDNSGVTLLTDSSVTASNGTLTSFGLTGAHQTGQQVRLLREPIVLI